MSVLRDYNVQFIIREKIGKTLSAGSDALAGYLFDYYSVDDANLLLAEVNAVLNGQLLLAGGMTQSLGFADITMSQTKIYNDGEAWQMNHNISPDFVLPTPHFKVILEAWRDFLAQ